MYRLGFQNELALKTTSCAQGLMSTSSVVRRTKKHLKLVRQEQKSVTVMRDLVDMISNTGDIVFGSVA